MVPDIAKTGHSFNGAMAYYLHDKRQEGQEAQPQTAERVAWTETRNLASDDPEAARRIMIATAKQADELKAAAGIKNTGRKSKAHVYAYSLAWHPDEAGQLDRAEMQRAVDSSLKALGAEGHQALIVCHRDQKHPHVHVILNRVHPETGVMLSTSNDRLKLSDWANEYERMRGVVLTPKREAKRQLREQFADKAKRQQYTQQQRQKADQRPYDSKSRAAMLKEFQERQKGQHRQAWVDLAQENKAKRGVVYDRSAAAIKEAAARHKAECKPIWAAYFKEVRDEGRAFVARERELSGKVANALEATRHQRATGKLGGRGTLSATFSNLLSSQARAQAFADRQEMNRQQMAARLKSILDDEIQQLKDERGRNLVGQRQSFDARRESLLKSQGEDRAKIRQAWQHIYDERDRSGGGDRQQEVPHDRYRQRMEVRNQIKHPDNQARAVWQDRRARNAGMNTAPARQEAAPIQEQKPMKREFDNARRIEKPQPVARSTPEFVAKPAPAPSPSGEVPQPAKRELQQVPVKKEQDAGRQDKKPAASAKRDWNAIAGVKSSQPIPEVKDWSTPVASKTAEPRRDWDALSKGKPTGKPIYTPQTPDKDRDRER